MPVRAHRLAGEPIYLFSHPSVHGDFRGGPRPLSAADPIRDSGYSAETADGAGFEPANVLLRHATRFRDGLLWPLGQPSVVFLTGIEPARLAAPGSEAGAYPVPPQEDGAVVSSSSHNHRSDPPYLCAYSAEPADPRVVEPVGVEPTPNTLQECRSPIKLGPRWSGGRFNVATARRPDI